MNDSANIEVYVYTQICTVYHRLLLSYMSGYNPGVNTKLNGCNRMLYRVLEICFDISAPIELNIVASGTIARVLISTMYIK